MTFPFVFFRRRSPYALLNPADKSANVTLSGNDHFSTHADSLWCGVRSTLSVSSGKWYWEITMGTSGGTNLSMPCIAKSTASLDAAGGGGDANAWGYYSGDGQKYNNSSGAAYGSTYTGGDVIGVAFDATGGKLWFSKNGTWQASGDPAAGTNEAFSGLTSGPYFAAVYGNGVNNQVANFGDTAFSGTPPSGFNSGIYT